MPTKSLAAPDDCCAGTAPTDPRGGDIYSCIFCDKEWVFCVAEDSEFVHPLMHEGERVASGFHRTIRGGWYESWDTFGGAK